MGASWSEHALRQALRGVRGVVHAASVVHRPGTPPADYTRFNVDGTRSLLAAARAEGVERFVFLSSIKVHGEHVSGVIDERTPVVPSAHYAETKAEAERLVADARELRPVIFRLCPVYGRGDKGNVRTVIRAVAHRRFVVPGDGSTRKSIVHVSTVAKIVAASAVRGDVLGTFVVADREAPTIRMLANTVADLLGRRRPPSVPVPIVRAAAGVVSRVARGLGVSSTLSADLVEKSLLPSICDPSQVERELGVEAHVDLRWAIADEVDWLRSARLL